MAAVASSVSAGAWGQLKPVIVRPQRALAKPWIPETYTLLILSKRPCTCVRMEGCDVT